MEQRRRLAAAAAAAGISVWLPAPDSVARRSGAALHAPSGPLVVCVEQAEERVLVVGGNAGRCRATERRIDDEDDWLNDEGKNEEFLLVSQVEESGAEPTVTWTPGATCDVTPPLGPALLSGVQTAADVTRLTSPAQMGSE